MTKYSKKPSFKVTGLEDVITEFALRLAALKDEHWLPSGTAVVIGSNLAITARHVITDFWDKHEYSPLSEGESEGTFSMVAGQFLDKGQTPLLWEVSCLWFSSITDVAFLRLSPASKEAANHVCTGVSMNLLPSRVGTRIAAFGYHSASIELSEEDDEQIIFEWNDSPTTSVGEVIQVHDERRDSVMLPFPCFQTNA